MKKFSQKVIVISFMVIAASIMLIIATLGYSLKSHSITEKPWVLQSYGNTVALFNGEEVVEVYNTIELDTLPEEDKRLLDSGISFLTKEEAVLAIEDYDG